MKCIIHQKILRSEEEDFSTEMPLVKYHFMQFQFTSYIRITRTFIRIVGISYFIILVRKLVETIDTPAA